MNCIRTYLVALALGAAAYAPLQAQVFKDLLPRVPEDANALVLIHAEKLRDSAFAKEFREKTLRGATDVNRHVVPNKDIDRVVLAAELNAATLSPIWETAVVDTNAPVSLELLAAQKRGEIERLGTTTALLLDTNAYLMKFDEELYGLFGPANRQRAMRWAQRAERESRLSPYLAKIAEFPETAGTEIMLALDVSGMIDVARLRENLQNSETLKAQPQDDGAAVADVLASIQGVALGVKATDSLNAKLRVDFATDPRLIKGYAKPLLLEKLGDMGLMIDDLESWTVTVDAKTVYFGGKLSPGGLRKVLSLIEPPAVPQAAAKMPEPSASDVDPMAYPSQRYFREIETLLSDMSSRENAKYAKQAGWYDKYARKVSQLSMVNVDPDLLDYGLSVSTAFRTMAYKLRNQAADASQYSNNRMTYWNAYGDWYNGYITTYHTEPSEREKAEKMSKMYGTMSYAETVQTVGNATSEIRRKMVERYKVDF